MNEFVLRLEIQIILITVIVFFFSFHFFLSKLNYIGKTVTNELHTPCSTSVARTCMAADSFFGSGFLLLNIMDLCLK